MRMKEITEDQMLSNLDQVQDILNHLIEGKKYDEGKLDHDKLVQYKLSIVKIIDCYRYERKADGSYINNKREAANTLGKIISGKTKL